jgi:transposase
MGKQRKTWSADQKQAVVLAALRGDHSIAELARQQGIREQLIYRWKADFLEAGARALGGSKTHRADEALKKENDQLKKLLGEKTLELDIVKKWSNL